MSISVIPALRNFALTSNVTSTQRHGRFPLDVSLLSSALLLLAIGLVMVASASVSIADRQMGDPFYYLWRQSAFVAVGLLVGFAVLNVRLVYWERLGPLMLLFGVSLLVVVLFLGREINGSVRWLSLGAVNFQPSELVKLLVVIYIAGYLVRRGDEVRELWRGLFKPMMLVMLIGILLLAEPDFGAVVVVTITAVGMIFLGGVRLWKFGSLLLGLLVLLTAAAMSMPYRMARLTSFVDPWADPFNSGFQLTQALIAFGRGEWLGVGLGGSVQKLFYLPEAHTDFLFAVLGEELGLIGVVVVISLFALIVWRAFVVGQSAAQAGDRFGAYAAYGIGMWLGLQAFINLGVNMGVLPTKGLTLPLMSYGGSSIVMSCVAVALLLRISHEHPVSKQPAARRATASRSSRKTTPRKSARKLATKRGRWA